MLKNEYFEYLDLPEIPQEIIDDIINHNGKSISFLHKFDEYKVYHPSDSLVDWVSANIKVKFDRIRIQEILEDLPPHTDPGRSYAINYVINTGGGVTSFYKPKQGYVYKAGFADVDKIDNVFSLDIEPNRWHRIHTKTIHGVSNITSTRLALTLHVA